MCSSVKWYRFNKPCQRIGGVIVQKVVRGSIAEERWMKSIECPRHHYSVIGSTCMLQQLIGCLPAFSSLELISE